MRNLLYAIALLLLATTVASCEKVIIVGQEEEGETNGATNQNEYVADDEDSLYMTVAEAQSAKLGDLVYVKGYIVASCERSMNNVAFWPPFEGSSAILIADEPIDTFYFVYEEENYFPVRLTDFTDVRAALNLEDNPELWNRRIYLVGTKTTYMRYPGLKRVINYQVK